MQPKNKHKIFSVRSVVTICILIFFILLGSALNPAAMVANAPALILVISAYVQARRSVEYVEGQKQVSPSRFNQILATGSIVSGLLGFFSSPFVWSVGFGCAGLVLAYMALRDRNYDREPGILESLSSAYVMSIIGGIFSFMTFASIYIISVTSPWPADPSLLINLIFADQ